MTLDDMRSAAASMSERDTSGCVERSCRVGGLALVIVMVFETRRRCCSGCTEESGNHWTEREGVAHARQLRHPDDQYPRLPTRQGGQIDRTDNVDK